MLNTVHVYRFPPPPAVGGVLGYLWEYGYSMAATFILSLVVFVRHGFDVVHAHNPPDTFVFIAAFYKLFGVRFVFDHHDLSPEMYSARFGSRSNQLIYHALVFLRETHLPARRPRDRHKRVLQGRRDAARARASATGSPLCGTGQI